MFSCTFYFILSLLFQYRCCTTATFATLKLRKLNSAIFAGSCLLCVLDWLTHCTIAPPSATGPQLAPLPHLLRCLFNFLSFFQTFLLLFLPLFFSPGDSLKIWNEAGLAKKEKKKRSVGGGEASIETHCYTLTYIRFQPSWSDVAARGQSRAREECESANGVGSSLCSSWLSPYSFQ